MKLALIGASSTGKSTLSHQLAKELRLPLIREQARVVLGEMGKTLKELRAREEDILTFQYEVLKHQVSSEKECAESGFVSDRSVFDNLILYLRHCPLSEDKVNRYFDFVMEHYYNLPYDLLIFLRPGEFPVENDGVRTPDEHYQHQIDGMILCFLRLNSIPYKVVRGDIYQRIRQVKAIIEEMNPGWLEEHLEKFNRAMSDTLGTNK